MIMRGQPSRSEESLEASRSPLAAAGQREDMAAAQGELASRAEFKRIFQQVRGRPPG